MFTLKRVRSGLGAVLFCLFFGKLTRIKKYEYRNQEYIDGLPRYFSIRMEDDKEVEQDKTR